MRYRRHACRVKEDPAAMKYFMQIPTPVDGTGPLIYRFSIPALGVVYHGKSINPGSRIREYHRNIDRMRAGRPYRKSRPGQWRAIHRAMHRAVEHGHRIELAFVENCADDNINERKRHWQQWDRGL